MNVRGVLRLSRAGFSLEENRHVRVTRVSPQLLDRAAVRLAGKFRQISRAAREAELHRRRAGGLPKSFEMHESRFETNSYSALLRTQRQLMDPSRRVGGSL
jgi:hypothetical protein